jgi:hypothetical protein
VIGKRPGSRNASKGKSVVTREVLIDNILEEHIAREGGPYADTLIIRFGRDGLAVIGC